MAQSGFTLVKEAHTGLYRWFSLYSNNFRDNDRPSEIISKESHERFVEMVDQGIFDYPELWLWHVPVVWGKADWLAFANGFAMASGTVYPEYNHVAENLAKETSLATSHGMPKRFILRDPQDESVLRFHVTKEISPLPYAAAANKRTGFVVLQGEQDMPLSDAKRAWLLDVAKLDPAFVKSIEETIEAESKAATEAGVESKETTVESADQAAPVATTEAQPSTEKPAEVPAATPEPTQDKEQNWATKEEVATVLGEVLTPLMATLTGLSTQVDSLTKELTALKRTDEERLTKLKEATPPASLRDLLARNLIGNANTVVKEGDPVEEDKPKEAPAQPSLAPTIVPFLNGLVTAAASAK